jgi:acetate kinase
VAVWNGSVPTESFVRGGNWWKAPGVDGACPDHAVAVRQCLDQLTDPEQGCLGDASEVAAIGFKAVHGGGISGVQRVDSNLLDAMEEMNEVAPAHNPPYIEAMRQCWRKSCPEFRWWRHSRPASMPPCPDRLRYYPVPKQWGDEYHVKRWGFHGASHRYIAHRVAELVGREDLRVISCHLGGSSSLCAIQGLESRGHVDGHEPAIGFAAQQSGGGF